MKMTVVAVTLLLLIGLAKPQITNTEEEYENSNEFTFSEVQQQQRFNSQCAEPPEYCDLNSYRTYNGLCNNLNNPTWGASRTPFARLLPPKFGDGISSETLSKSGKELPWPRRISLLLHPEVRIQDPKFTLAAMQFGQFIAHDMSLIAEVNAPAQCCTPDGQRLKSNPLPAGCFSILFPEDDPQMRLSNRTCINFGRTLTTRNLNCTNAEERPEQVSIVTHFLDLSQIYGSTPEVNQMIREFNGGRLRVAKRNSKDWPPRAVNVTRSCPFARSSEPCYIAGDIRVNQNPELTVIQVTFLRRHNRLARGLSQLNPHWDDETIFQEARKINIASFQHITYYEWLPIFIGISNAYTNKIIYKIGNDFVDDYNPNVNPSVLNEHATSASRFYHSLIVGFLDLLNNAREVMSNIRLSDWFNRPAVIEKGDNFHRLIRGLITQPQDKANQFVDEEVTQHLFRPPDQPFGRDLKAIDIARNRDHGLSSYNDFRAFCGLPKAETFDDFLDVISKKNVKHLETLYEDPDDVDLAVGSSLEKFVPGTLAGPVNLCILTEQFYRTRVGDRYFYENGSPNTGAGFTIEQLNEIRKVTFARILCENGDNITTVQPFVFHRLSASNQLTSCERIPKINLLLWKEDAVDTTNTDFLVDAPHVFH